MHELGLGFEGLGVGVLDFPSALVSQLCNIVALMITYTFFFFLGGGSLL